MLNMTTALLAASYIPNFIFICMFIWCPLTGQYMSDTYNAIPVFWMYEAARSAVVMFNMRWYDGEVTLFSP